MSKRSFDLYNPYPNKSVTDYYVETIEKAIRSCGHNTQIIDKIRKSSHNDGIVIVHPKDYLPAKRCGYKTVVLWIQGLIPEESYMRNHSRLRVLMLSAKEYMGVLKSDMILMVSKRMKEHYEKKYHIDFKDRVMFMPCFNSELDKNSFDVTGKYEKNIFTYSGGLAVWQCFEPTVKLYAEVEKAYPNSEFWVYTSDKEQAESIIGRYGVKNYKIDFVTPEQLNYELRKVKYGFVLREPNEVNFVATPTKLSSYMANGVIPVFSNALTDFAEHTKNMKNVIRLDSFSAKPVIDHCGREIDKNEVREEYTELFDSYYNAERYIEEIADRIKNL